MLLEHRVQLSSELGVLTGVGEKGLGRNASGMSHRPWSSRWPATLAVYQRLRFWRLFAAEALVSDAERLGDAPPLGFVAIQFNAR